MRQFCLAVLLALLATTGCYTDAPPQSTLPEPEYASGPPGGAIDPSSGYRPYGGEPGAGSVAPVDPGAPGGAAVAEAPDDFDPDAPGDPAAAPIEASPDPSALAVGPAVPTPDEAGAPEADGSAAAPEAAVAPTGGITDTEIDAPGRLRPVDRDR